MSRKLVLLAFISFFILIVLVSQVASSQSMANGQCVIPQSGTVYYPNVSMDRTLAGSVHNIDTGLSYTTIQAAIDAAETLDGHTIFVEEGTYYEHLYIDKSLTLFGDTIGTTVINGSGASQVVDIKADNVDISNFLITNGWTGFYIRDSSHNRIWQNTITNTEKAIYIYGYVPPYFASFNTISENTISNNICGIDDGGVNTTIVGNTVTFNEQGIAGGVNTTIVGNTVASNDEGMYLGRNNTVISNTIKSNFLGVVIGTGSKLRGNKLDENRFNFVSSRPNLSPQVAHNDIDTTNKINGKNIYYIMNQTNLLIDSSTTPNISYLALIQCQNVTVRDLTLSSNGEGIMLSDCINCTIQNCQFRSNIVGIMATASNTCLIGNNIIDNLQGIKLTGDHNEVTNNIIINNTIRSLPYTYPDKWPNRWAQTYLTFLIDGTWGVGDFPSWSGGLYLCLAENCTISSNNIAHNEHGILLFCSRYNVLKNNSMTDNVYNFGIRHPYYPIEWARNPPDHPQISPYLMHSIDSSNTVDGKPICYWIGKHHQIVPSDAGYVALINCTDIVAQNLVLTHNYRDVLLVATKNILLSHNAISGTKFGIEITNQGAYDFPLSANNTIQENNITNTGISIYLSTSNNSVCNNLLTSNLLAIVVDKDSNEIIGNIMANNVQPPIEEWLLGFYPPHENDISWRWRYPYHGSAYGGIILETSNTFVHRNKFTSNDFGLALEPYFSNKTYANVVTANIFVNNEYGIWLEAMDNMFYHNNFVNNAYSVYIDPRLKGNVPPDAFINTWDNGVEGNYWSDYTGHDSDNNGIGDSAYYDIGWANQDNHPLMGQFFNFNTSLGKHVNVISNSTVEGFGYFESSSTIRMYVSGEPAYGFCRACIPHELMDTNNISVIIDDGATAILYPNYTLYDNGTHRWIYFAYQHSTLKIDILPEFPSLILLPLFMTATLLAVIVYRRKSKD